jgi:copper oxidase (laccase) domain-containing protein
MSISMYDQFPARALSLDVALMVQQAPTELGMVSNVDAIGIVPTGGDSDGGEQWDLGIRSNLKPESYPDHAAEIEEINIIGAENARRWAAAFGIQALARPLRSVGQGQMVRLDQGDFLPDERGGLLAVSAEPADFVMVSRDDAPENAGVMYGVADSHTVTLFERGSGDHVGVIHGIRNAVVAHNIGSRAVDFMCEESTGGSGLHAKLSPADLVAVVGPGAQTECHRVGDHDNMNAVTPILQAIRDGYVPANALRETDGGSFYFDTQAALIQQLTSRGVGMLIVSKECSARQPSGGHERASAYPFPSLRRANDLRQGPITRGGVVIPLRNDDKVSRYPVMARIAA